MLRSILGGIAGYIVMVVAVFVLFTVLWMALGADGAFQPGSYQVSMTWIAGTFVLAFIAAVAGGYSAALVGKGMTAVKITCGIVLVLGVLTIIATAVTPAATEARAAGVPMMEAIGKAQTPLWVAIINPVIGIVGALIGGRLRKA